MYLKNSNKKTINFLTVIALVYSAANAGEDGRTSIGTQLTGNRASLVSESCVEAASWCPEYPVQAKIERSELLAALKDEAWCGDSEFAHFHPSPAVQEMVSEVGNEELAGTALAHVILRDTGLQMHGVKLALEMLAELDAGSTMATFEEIYRHSNSLASRYFEQERMPNLSPSERESLIQKQAADLRRSILVFLGANQSQRANSLLEIALDDEDLSVAVAAGRELLNRPPKLGSVKLKDFCSNTSDDQRVERCRLIRSGGRHASVD